LLFIGAICSKDVGSQDLQDLTLKVKDALKKKEYKEVLKDIDGRLESVNQNYQFFNEGEIDLEVILSILNANADYKDALKEVGPFAIYLSTFADTRKLALQLISTEDLSEIRKTIGTSLLDLWQRNTSSIICSHGYYQL
jgi:hypothetical protein